MYLTFRSIAQTAHKTRGFVFKQETSTKSDYHFIDFVRFVSIIGIVSLHSTFLPKNISLNNYLNTLNSPATYIGFISILRFAVISFCIISGYLLAPRISTENKLAFYYTRVKNTLRPSIIALLITAALILIKEIFTGEQRGFAPVINELVFDGVFWFIPMQLLSLLILMLFITAPKQVWVGITLFMSLAVVTAYYVYFKKLAHVDPVFALGFAFYFWLGTMFYKYKVIEKVKRIKLVILLAAWLASFTLLNFETLLLWKNGFPHILNNLRISNQLYGVVSFFVLVKVSDYFKSFSVFKPRKESFGIYLYHRAVGLAIFFILHRVFNLTGNFDAFTSMFFTLTHFIFTYAITTVLVKWLVKWELFFLSKNGQYPNARRILLSLKNSSNIIL